MDATIQCQKGTRRALLLGLLNGKHCSQHLQITPMSFRSFKGCFTSKKASHEISRMVQAGAIRELSPSHLLMGYTSTGSWWGAKPKPNSTVRIDSVFTALTAWITKTPLTACESDAFSITVLYRLLGFRETSGALGHCTRACGMSKAWLSCAGPEKTSEPLRAENGDGDVWTRYTKWPHSRQNGVEQKTKLKVKSNQWCRLCCQQKSVEKSIIMYDAVDDHQRRQWSSRRPRS